MAEKKKKSTQVTKESLPKELPQALVHGMEFHRSIHETLKYLRQDAGLTLEALSLVTKGVDPEGKGVSRVSLSRYETGAEPGLRELKILSWAFRKPIAFLVYGYSFDPFASEQEDPLEIIIENIIYKTVGNILERRGLVDHEESVDTKNYKTLIETAKRLAK